MNSLESLDKKRLEILEKISSIHSMRKGVISEYFVKSKLKDGTIKTNGPYHTLSLKGANNKTVGEKIPSDMLEFFKTDVENYKRFRELSDEFITVCEQVSKQSAQTEHSDEQLKKNKKSK